VIDAAKVESVEELTKIVAEGAGTKTTTPNTAHNALAGQLAPHFVQ
jgi:hypothetical protein